jgi:hypothetical protein
MNKIPLNIEDTSVEIFARIVKSEANKYGCDVEVDFSDENRDFFFKDEDECNSHIVADVRDIFV